MTFQQELNSWLPPSVPSSGLATVPTVGSKAPSTDRLPLPPADGRKAVVSFLRHCGCPFAEKTFLRLRAAASDQPTNSKIKFVAVSHSDAESTQNWLDQLDGPGNVEVIVDGERKLYAEWGLGPSSLLHFLSPLSMWSVVKLGREEGIWNRPTESGSRWQTAGTWGLDETGTVRWGGQAWRADDVADVDECVKVLNGEKEGPSGGEDAKL